MINMSYADDIIRDLKARGFRLTRLRKALLRELDLARKPLSPADIMESLKNNDLRPHKTSVYREIGFLIKQGLITRITFGEKQDRFELSAMDHHHHAVCQSCGDIEDIDCSESIARIEELLDNHDFKVSSHLVEFFGLCKSCRTEPA